MAATPPQGPDRTTEEVAAEPDKMKDQLHSSIPARSISSNASQEAVMGHSRETSQSGSFVSGEGCRPPNVYAPQAQAFFYPGFENANGEWDDYPSYINSEGIEIGSPGLYNDNPSLLFHSGYGFNPQMPYGPYSPVTTPLPSVGGDPQLYSTQQFPYSGPPYYHQLVSPSLPYISSPSQASQPELTNLAGVDRPGDSMVLGPRPSYSSMGSFGRGSFPGAIGSFGFHDSQQGFDGSRSPVSGIWSDCSKPSDRQMSMMPLSPAVSPQPLGSFGQSVGMASHQQPPLYGFGSGSGLKSYGRDYVPNQGSRFGGTAVSNLGVNGRNWLSLENSRRRDRRMASLHGCDGTHHVLSEQNRGPRASKLKNNLLAEKVSVDNGKKSASTTKVHNESFNRPEFITDYKDASFFVIKSYSEDNVHKSIKYGIWASTPNGNRKLDAAYRQAKEKQDACPVFLLFSVNASAHFCGVAEMVGPVDFDKSVDYWQQDKWSGQFPVKWHIIKDVPNSQFRHIVLENNDNKPVTNSRDTQEVKLQQGIEILIIFKNYEAETSIIDDFDYYEDRQKAMQDQKARQQGSLLAATAAEGEHKSSAPANINDDFVNHMSKSFAQVRLEENSNQATATDRGSLTTDASNGTAVKLEDCIPVTSSSSL